MTLNEFYCVWRQLFCSLALCPVLPPPLPPPILPTRAPSVERFTYTAYDLMQMCRRGKTRVHQRVEALDDQARAPEADEGLRRREERQRGDERAPLHLGNSHGGDDNSNSSDRCSTATGGDETNGRESEGAERRSNMSLFILSHRAPARIPGRGPHGGAHCRLSILRALATIKSRTGFTFPRQGVADNAGVEEVEIAF